MWDNNALIYLDNTTYRGLYGGNILLVDDPHQARADQLVAQYASLTEEVLMLPQSYRVETLNKGLRQIQGAKLEADQTQHDTPLKVPHSNAATIDKTSKPGASKSQINTRQRLYLIYYYTKINEGNNFSVQDLAKSMDMVDLNIKERSLVNKLYTLRNTDLIQWEYPDIRNLTPKGHDALNKISTQISSERKIQLNNAVKAIK